MLKSNGHFLKLPRAKGIGGTQGEGDSNEGGGPLQKGSFNLREDRGGWGKKKMQFAENRGRRGGFHAGHRCNNLDRRALRGKSVYVTVGWEKVLGKAVIRKRLHVRKKIGRFKNWWGERGKVKGWTKKVPQ